MPPARPPLYSGSHALALLLIVALGLCVLTRSSAASNAVVDTFYIEVDWAGPGAVVPDGMVPIPRGGSQAFQFIPTGCAVSGMVTVDDIEVGVVDHYTFTNVQSDHVLYVPFGLQAGDVTLTVAPEVGSCAARETLTAVVPAATQGEVTFRSNGLLLGRSNISNGVARLMLGSPLFNGDYVFTADYSGSSCVEAGSSAPLNYNVSDAGAGTVDATLFFQSGGLEGYPNWFRLLVTRNGQPVPGFSGIVEVFDAGVRLTSVSVGPSGNVDFNLNLLRGIHSISCRLTPSRCYPPVDSNELPVDINWDHDPTTTISLTISPERGTVGKPVDVTLSVTPNGAAGYLSATIQYPYRIIGEVLSTNGTGHMTFVPLEPGTHSINIRFTPTNNYYAYSYVDYIPFEVDPHPTGPQPAQVTLSADPPAVAIGGTLTFRARMTPTNATGEVAFFDRFGGYYFGTLQNGEAALPLTFTVPGATQYGVRYFGDALHTASLDSVISVAYSPRAFPRIVVDHDPALAGQTITCNAMLDTLVTGGTASFYLDELLGATVPFVNGMASWSFTGFSGGVHSLVAKCSQATGQVSNVVLLTVTPVVPEGLHLTAPNGGEQLTVGSIAPIRWDTGPAANAPRVALWIQRSPADAWEVIDSDVPNTGSYDWLTTGPATGDPPTLLRSARLAITDAAGIATSDTSDAEFWVAPAGVLDVEPLPRAGGTPALAAPHPSPSSGPVACEFTLPREQPVRLSVVDVQGREVQVLFDGTQREGRHAVSWDSRGALGPAPAGLYFLRLATANETLVRRVTILR